LTHLLQRLGGAGARFVAVVIVALTFTFVVESLLPVSRADPTPLPERFLAWWGSLMTPPVWARISNALPWTIALVGSATIVAFTVGTFLGAWVGRPDRHRAAILVALPLVLAACVPAYIIGKVLVALFTRSFHWLPPALGYAPTQLWQDPLGVSLDLAGHAVLPMAAIALAGIGMFALLMRGAVVSIASDDHVLYASSQGLPDGRLFRRHLVRPALLSQVTALGLALGVVVSGALLVEATFSYPGLGWLLNESIIGTDAALMRGVMLVLVVGLAAATTLLDLLLPMIDPRVRR
jgi:peptide/nickel transport system permease protein